MKREPAARPSAAPSPDPFSRAVEDLKGVGPKRSVALRARGFATALDLLLLAPTRYVAPPPLADVRTLTVGMDTSILGTVTQSRRVKTRRGRGLAEVRLDNAGAPVRALFFNRDWFADRAVKDATVLVWGRVTAIAPLVIAGVGLRPLSDAAEAPIALARLEPVHPTIEGVAEGTLRRLVREALTLAAAAEDPLPVATRTTLKLPPLIEALRQVHEPATREEADAGGARLLFDRLLALALDARRATAVAAAAAPRLTATARIRERIAARLPFQLTVGQSAALDEILSDLAQPIAMRRLLLGDVGSGKTAVAAGALLATVAAGMQGLFVAPTDALAAQHADVLGRWLTGSRVRLGLLTARTTPPEKKRLKAAAAAGELDLLIGTHAVLAASVHLPKLGLAVVDEQHRFGVVQRLRAREKTERPHLLALSATPIPRSLALALYGDLALTRLLGRPSDRAAPRAQVVRSEAAFAALRAAVARGEKAFVVFPSIRGETAPAVEREGRALARRGGPLADLPTAWLHGAMPAAERDAAMAAFRSGGAQVLVATTIVEVGIDVPAATQMVVVGAERLGLATLHQLRGRVGRGERPGVLWLIDSSDGKDPAAGARLKLLEREQDGMKLAEADLFLRGPGDFCGVRQHGHGGALPLREGRDKGFLDAAAETARSLVEGGYDLSRGYYARLAATLGGVRFDPPDAV